MSEVTTSPRWQLSPGDLVLVEPHQGCYNQLHRTTNEIEAQQLLQRFEGEGRTVLVFRFIGSVGL